MRNASIGHAVFAATLIALGLLGLIEGGFTVIWQPVFDHVPAARFLAGLCAVVSLACGLGLFGSRSTSLAARVLFFYTLLWLLAFKLPLIVRAPLSEGSYQYCSEMAVIVAAAWVLHAWFATDTDRGRLAFAALSAVMMGVFLLLIWLPMVAARHISAFNWGETYATWVLTATAWVVADSWRGVGWLGAGK